jgi:iron complex outermembrane receptor protein
MGGQPGVVGANGAMNFEMPVRQRHLYSFDTASTVRPTG